MEITIVVKLVKVYCKNIVKNKVREKLLHCYMYFLFFFNAILKLVQVSNGV